MKLIDSHCHLDCIDLAPEHDGDIDNLINEALKNEVAHMLCVCITLDDLPKVQAISRHYDCVSHSVGVHPNEAPGVLYTYDELYQHAKADDCVAIGETGLDYFRSEGDLGWQQERFKTHIKLAKDLDKPLIIHTRDAKDDTIRILREENASKGVMHCFAEDWDTAKQALDLGFYISFAGIVTFKNAHVLKDVAKKVPLDRMLIETDSPYLAPHPNRGKQNRPAWVRFVAEHIAELRDVQLEQIAEVTTNNFTTLFSVNLPA